MDIRVYYEDTDMGGVVFYANYLKYMERGRTEWLRTLGVNQSALATTEQRGFMVVRVDVRYISPARLDDLLQIESEVTRLGRASLHFAQSVSRNGELIAQSNIQVCCVETVNMQVAAIPESVRIKLAAITQE
ncbi:MAG: tol-pal system-associated acyl-CoA thioesterase [Burkholderiaceae bacterium]|nr:tol-pal system-associated acyl-CoA thioesterase [Burkholderiaceae bacterium]